MYQLKRNYIYYGDARFCDSAPFRKTYYVICTYVQRPTIQAVEPYLFCDVVGALDDDDERLKTNSLEIINLPCTASQHNTEAHDKPIE